MTVPVLTKYVEHIKSGIKTLYGKKVIKFLTFRLYVQTNDISQIYNVFLIRNK